MKIIQVNASYKPAFIYGGPTMSVSKLSEVLISNNISLEVLTTSANGKGEINVKYGEIVLVDNVPVTYYKRLTKDHSHFSPALQLGLYNKIGQNRKHLVVHIHAWWNLVSILSCLLAIIKNIPVLLSPRGTLSSYSFINRNNFIKKIIFKLSKPLLERCHFHVTSDNEKQSILHLITPKSMETIPNMVNLPDRKIYISNQGNGPFKLLFLSRIEEKKGIEFLFSALTEFSKEYHLSIAGSGDLKYVDDLKKLACALSIDHNISWLGHQASEKKFDLMSNYDLFVLPSYNENFANVVIESLSTGTAVLITENVGLSDYVLEKDLGWVCRFDVKDLTEKLNSAYKNRDKRTRIRQTGPDIIREDFSDDILHLRYVSMYKRILKIEKSHIKY